MAWREYTIAQELNLDHDEVCDHCGATYHVVLRAQSTGFSRSEKRARQHASDFLTMEAQSVIRLWHRCTHCGRYSRRHIEAMKAAYRIYRSNRRIAVGSCIFGAILFGSLPVAALMKGCLANAPMVVLVLSLLAAVCLVCAWAFRPMTHWRFTQAAGSVNNPQTVEKWLRSWRKYAPPALEAMQRGDRNILSADDPWEKIKRLQHKYDPIHPRWAKACTPWD